METKRILIDFLERIDLSDDNISSQILESIGNVEDEAIRNALAAYFKQGFEDPTKVIEIEKIEGLPDEFVLGFKAGFNMGTPVDAIPKVIATLRIKNIDEQDQSANLKSCLKLIPIYLDLGLTIDQSLKLSRAKTKNKQVIAVIDSVLDSIVTGGTIAGALKDTAWIPPDLVEAVEEGERSGTLLEILGGL